MKEDKRTEMMEVGALLDGQWHHLWEDAIWEEAWMEGEDKPWTCVPGKGNRAYTDLKECKTL